MPRRPAWPDTTRWYWCPHMGPRRCWRCWHGTAPSWTRYEVRARCRFLAARSRRPWGGPGGDGEPLRHLIIGLIRLVPLANCVIPETDQRIPGMYHGPCGRLLPRRAMTGFERRESFLSWLTL